VNLLISKQARGSAEGGDLLVAVRRYDVLCINQEDIDEKSHRFYLCAIFISKRNRL
jgi:hypothetical protein